MEKSPATWPRDVLASVVVFLVALPLCMGVALASGVPPALGLVTGIVGGLVVGALAGSPLQVSGPAAGLTVLIWEFLRPYNESGQADRGLMLLGVAVLTAGVLQLAMGLMKMGQWFRAVSPAVIHGMLAGIGMLIFASQFHVMVDDTPKGSGLKNLLSIPEAISKGLDFDGGGPLAFWAACVGAAMLGVILVWKALAPERLTVVPILLAAVVVGTTAAELLGPDGADPSHVWAARVGVLTITVIVLWKTLAPKKWQLVPAPLLAVLGGTLIAEFLALDGIKRVALPGLTEALRWPDIAALADSFDLSVVKQGIVIALIASAETLLCASAVDQMHTGPRTQYDRELSAQGIGNMICGLFGALPMTGVIVRSAANVEAGAKSRLSTMLHGLWLLLAMLVFAGLLRRVPTAALAAVLVFTGFKLMDPKPVRELWRYSKSEVAIYFATFLGIVFTDLLTGVLIGIGLSAAKLVYTFSHLGIRLEDDVTHGRTILHLDGAATFVRLPQLAAVLEAVPANTELHVHFEKLNYIDHACLDLLMNWEKQHEATGGSLVLDWESLTARFRQAPANGDAAGRTTDGGGGR